MSNTTPDSVPFVFPEQTERVEYKHNFNNDELLELGEQLTKQLREKNQMELDKKSAASTWKSRIEAKEAELNITSNYLNDGYKFEPVEAKKRVIVETLSWGLYHPETWDLIDTVKMTTQEIRKYFPKRKNLISKTLEWYNPYTEQTVDSRPMTTDELQLTIDEELAAKNQEEAEEETSDDVPNTEEPNDELFPPLSKPKRKKRDE